MTEQATPDAPRGIPNAVSDVMDVGMKQRPGLARVTGVLASFVLAAAHPAQAATQLDDLTGPWQLLVDDYAVATKTALVRTYHPFQKYSGNPVLVADRPWEGTEIYVYGTVLPNETGAGYRIWYHCIPGDTDKYRLLYATSTDGIHWDKPNLGVVIYDGSTNNNIFIRRSGQDHIPSVIHTPWEIDPLRRYKLINFDGVTGQFMGAWCGDGIHWLDVPDNPIVPPASDVGNFVWDPHAQQYTGYMKVGAFVNGLKRRAVGYTATTNFLSWPAPYLILAPETADDWWATGIQRTHFYGLCGFAYESMYLGFLWVFRATDSQGYYDGTIFIELVSSHDGIHWTREEGSRPPILPLGPAGSWDCGMLFTTQHPLVECGTIKLYYGGFDVTHASPSSGHGAIGLATLRKDGFASLDAGSTVGSLTTKKLVGASGPLHVNYSATAGWFKAEVLDENGNVLPGYGEADCGAMQSDSLDQIVTWATHTELPSAPTPIRLRFSMQNASLYSYRAGGAIDVMQEPLVTQQPRPQDICPGGSAQFTVVATSNGDMTYQWQKNGANLADGGHAFGATTPRLVLFGAVGGDAGDYRCVVTNTAGSTTSDAAALSFTPTSLTGVGVLPGGTTSSVAGVTADGTVVCGASANTAFIWTAANGIRSLGLPAGATTSSAVGVGVYSGNLVVAVNSNTSTYLAKRWDGNTAGVGTYSNLPRMDGNQEWTPRALGTNGITDLWIAGSSINGGDGNGREAGRYQLSSNDTISYNLPSGGHDHSDFHVVSDNGFFVGQFQYPGIAPSGGARNGMKSNGTSCVALNTLYGVPVSTHEAVTKAISRDGLVEGGWSAGSISGTTPVIWYDPTVVTAVPFLAGDGAGETKALNGDGSIAAGYSRTASGSIRRAWIWDSVNGTRDVAVLLQSYGLDLTGWQLNEVLGMSGTRAGNYTGLVLIGAGTHNNNSEGWVAVFGYTPTAPPSITQHPQAQNACPGATATFAVTATGQTPLIYQWQKNGVYVSDGGHYSGTTTPTLTVADIDAVDAAQYSCVVATSCGSPLTSNPAALTLRVATVITQDPISQLVSPGGTIQFAATATGDGSLSHQWQRNGTDLSDVGHYSGVTTPVLTVSSVSKADVADYRCVVTGGCGSVTSRSATLTLKTNPADFDLDGDVDLDDFSLFQMCFSGPNRPAPFPECGVTDLDHDSDVDLHDFALFQACFNGPNRLATCAQ